jgi:O-antigen/teichoic acid export membrane protein
MSTASASTRLRQIALYGVSRGSTEGLFAARGLVLAALLGPAAFGAWTLFRLAARYLGLAELGIRQGLEFEVAKTGVDARGHAERSKGAVSPTVRTGRAAVGFTGLVFGPIGVLAVVASFLVADPLTALALRVLALTLLAERLWLFGIAYMRSTGSLRSFAILETTSAALHLVLTTLLALRWGLGGAFAGFALAIIASLMLLRGRAPLRPALSSEATRRMLRVGIPFGLTVGMSMALVTVDRLVVAAYGGTVLLGYYGFAVAISGMAASGAWVVRTVVFPDVYRTVGESGGATAVSDLLRETMTPFLILYPVLLGLAALFIAPAVTLALPQYAEAVAPARILIFGGATAGISSLGSIGLVAVSKQRVLPLLAGLALLFNLGFSAWFLSMGFGITAVAGVALLSRVGYGGAVLSITTTSSGVDAAKRLTLKSLIPLAYCVGSVALLGALFPGSGWNTALISAGLYLLLVTPLLIASRREARKVSW